MNILNKDSIENSLCCSKDCESKITNINEINIMLNNNFQEAQNISMSFFSKGK